MDIPQKMVKPETMSALRGETVAEPLLVGVFSANYRLGTEVELDEPFRNVWRDPQTPPREAIERFADRVEGLLNVPAGSEKRLTLIQGSFEGVDDLDVGGVSATREGRNAW